ncbi:hypothetical protein [Desulfopila sp. IMCC35008]|uniref:hypothetical protein n=1 Tax=Desulfopila sp. IMCC35008 TaxID=2653858 RepID=UPI0013D446EC|nr:hypothetical protein [Desulfopila sp. IMCC35008]
MKKILAVLIILFLCSPAVAKNEKKDKKIPPGLQKKYERTGELPPGWQKKLVKGEVIDDRIYIIGKKSEINIEEYQIEPKVGTEVLRIEDRIIRIKKDTKEILEVFGIKAKW